jgi:transposase
VKRLLRLGHRRARFGARSNPVAYRRRGWTTAAFAIDPSELFRAFPPQRAAPHAEGQGATGSAANERLAAFERHIEELVPEWSMAPFVAAYQALRGVSLIVAATFAVEVGDVRRFENPRQLMAFLGLVPSERSTGESVRRGGLTLAGNRRARRVLVEGAWGYRHPARVSETIQKRLEGLPKVVREIAWKAVAGDTNPRLFGAAGVTWWFRAVPSEDAGTTQVRL